MHGEGARGWGASSQTLKGLTCQAKALGPRPRHSGKSDGGFKARQQQGQNGMLERSLSENKLCCKPFNLAIPPLRSWTKRTVRDVFTDSATRMLIAGSLAITTTTKLNQDGLDLF